MKSFLQYFGKVIVSSHLKEIKGYSPGFFFLGFQKKCGKKYTILKHLKREIEWHLF